MGKLKKSDVEHVAKLANLKLNSNQIDKFQRQLSEVVVYINELSEVDTKGVEPASQTTGLHDITRADDVDSTQTLSTKEALSGTEKIFNDYFVVPHVFSDEN